MPPKRTKITSIQVALKHPDGSTETVSIDPTTNNALLWTDEGVLKLLLPYYNTRQDITDTANGFQSKNLNNVIKIVEDNGIAANQTFSITPNFIGELWMLPINHDQDNTPVEKMVLRPFLTMTTENKPGTTPFKFK